MNRHCKAKSLFAALAASVAAKSLSAFVMFACALSASAATYWAGSVEDPDWLKAENWSNSSGPVVPYSDNMYFTDDTKCLATITQDFTCTGSLCIHSGLDSKPLVIESPGRTFRTTGAIRINDERSWRRGVVVFRGGPFNASSMTVGSVITNFCLATLENTTMKLSAATTVNQGRLTLGPGATLETTRVSYGTGTNDAFLVFNGGTLRIAPFSASDVFVPASSNFTVSVGAAGGTIDTSGRSLTFGASIADAPGEAGRMAFAGGGKVLLTGEVGWTGGTTVEAGTCLAVTNGPMKDAILKNGLAVEMSDAWLEEWSAAPGDVSLLRIDSAFGRFDTSDPGRISMAGGAAAGKTLRLSDDRKEILMTKPVVYSGTMSGSGTLKLANLAWNRSIPSGFSTRDIVYVKCTADSTLTIDRNMGVSAVAFDVASGVTLLVNGAGSLRAARLRLTGGGTLRFGSDPSGIGAVTVEAGSCIEVLTQNLGSMLFRRELTVVNPAALIDRNGAVQIVRNVGTGVFSEGDAAKVAFPGGLRPAARLSADARAVEIAVARHTATLSGGTKSFSGISWSPALTSAPGTGDVLVLNVTKDTVLDLDSPIHPLAVKFAVTSGKKLTLTGCDVSAPFVWQSGGSVVVSNVLSSLGTNVARYGRLLGSGTFAAGPEIARCDIEDVSGFAGTLDSGAGSASSWRTVLKGGARLSPGAGGEVSVLAGGSATLAADSRPFGSGEGATVKGTLRICDGGEIFARESGTASGGRYVLDKGARLRVRFTNSGVSPSVNNIAD